MGLNWDDLRFVVCLSRAGSLAAAARILGVDHTTVGRRVEAAERALGLRLFLRGPGGYVLTPDGQRLLGSLEEVEAAVRAVHREAEIGGASLSGRVRITSPETFGVRYLAPRLAAFGQQHPDLTVELTPSGQVLDLSRGEAEIAVRFFRSRDPQLVVVRAAEVAYGAYASPEYLREHPILLPKERPDALRGHRLLLPPTDRPSIEGDWLSQWTGGTRPTFVSELSMALMEAARAHAGITVLPRYLGDGDPALTRIELPDAPSEPVWLTVHEDVRRAPRVAAILRYLTEALRADQPLLRGTPAIIAPGA